MDMDGTIADLYGIAEWLPRLQHEDATIFTECAPLVSESVLLQHFPTDKYDIKILTMTPKGATAEYCEQVKEQKIEWLNKYFPSIKTKIFKKYGDNKNLKNSAMAVLVDDNEKIRQNFRGVALDPANLWG